MARRSDARTEFLSDVMTTAVEGGINHWASVSEYRWDRDKHAADAIGVTIHDDSDEGDDFESKRITLDDIASAIAKIRANKDDAFAFAHSGGYWVQFWLADRTNGEDGDYDAGIADTIVQVAVHGEVVYG